MATSYDQVPYPCHAHSHTHPAHLALIARLRGVPAAEPETCRYLEIGCGDGGNLLPMAMEYPRARFLGIDLAETSIEAARGTATRFGVGQVAFEARDILDLDAGALGQWDYIVAHGVFSWVPEPVRRRLLEVCRAALAPGGVAYISYNAYPGSHLRAMMREMMLYHTAGEPEPAATLAGAKSLMAWVAQNQSEDPADAVAGIVRSEANRVLGYAPNYFYHDDLSEENQPYYLHEFAALAADHGLGYLGDADYASMFDTRYPPEVRRMLADCGDDAVRREQYLDFIKCRRFRHSLLCHAEARLEQRAPLGVIEGCLFSSSAQAEPAGARLDDESRVVFRWESDLRGELSAPIAKQALAALGRHWPVRLTFPDLLSALSAASGRDVSRQALAGALRDLIEMGAAEAHLGQIRHATAAGERPRVSAWALHQLRSGHHLTSLRHHTVEISDEFGIWLVGQLDGTRTVEEIAQQHARTVKPSAGRAVDRDEVLRKARKRVAAAIEKLVRLGFVLPEDGQPGVAGASASGRE